MGRTLYQRMGATLSRVVVFIGLAAVLGGCQFAPVVSVSRLERHRDEADLSGLTACQVIQDLKVSWAVPRSWDSLPLKRTALYTHQQWRSPSLATGVGVAHIQLPLPLPAHAILWLAKTEYLKHAQAQSGGKLIAQWTDALGRQWFEAENSRYHVRGYAITRGNEAWIVYSGWRMSHKWEPAEIALAQRSVESIVPANWAIP